MAKRSNLVTGARAEGEWRFPFRAIETNEPMHWNGPWLERVLAMMRARGFNALVAHQNDLLDALTHLEDDMSEGVGDLRRKIVYSRVAWVRRLTRRLAAQEARLYLEVKEPSFADYILDLYPGLTDGIGPENPLWPEIVGRKVRAITEALPDLGGLIVSLSSPESRVPPGGAGFGDWLERMIEAIRAPLAAAGMELIVRDFTYGPGLHDATISALNQPRPGMGASVKVSPCDYFPTFPNNTAARRLTDVPVVVEFEAFGENTGWGVVPNCRVAELAERMGFVDEIGARGLIIRINWEGVLGWSAIDCTSDVNIHALSQLMGHETPSPEQIVRDWVQARYGAPSDRAAQLLLESFDCVKAIYWHGNVFPRHSQIPLTWQQGWWSMRAHALSDWSAEDRSGDFALTDENQSALFAEKAQAVAKAERLAAEMGRLVAGAPGLGGLALPFDNLPVWLRAFELATQGAFHAARGEASPAAEGLEVLVPQFQARAQAAEGSEMEHVAAVMFDPSHLRSFAASLRGH